MWLDPGQELGTGSQGPAFPAWLLEGPAEHPPNLGKLAPLQEMGKGRAVSWRAKATELLGDHGMQRQDTCDFLQLLMGQPRVLEPNSVPWGWWQPPAQPSLWEVGEQQEGAQGQALHPPLSEPRPVRSVLLLPLALLPSSHSPCPALWGTRGSAPAWIPFGVSPRTCPAYEMGEKGPETPAPLARAWREMPGQQWSPSLVLVVAFLGVEGVWD